MTFDVFLIVRGEVLNQITGLFLNASTKRFCSLIIWKIFSAVFKMPMWQGSFVRSPVLKYPHSAVMSVRTSLHMKITYNKMISLVTLDL